MNKMIHFWKKLDLRYLNKKKLKSIIVHNYWFKLNHLSHVLIQEFGNKDLSYFTRHFDRTHIYFL